MKKIFTLFILSFSILFAQNPGDIIITEIMQNPSAVSDSDGEWFEVYNKTNADIDIDGWIIRDNDFDIDTVNSGGPLIVSAFSFFVFGRNADTLVNGNYQADYQYSSFFLSNGADEVFLTLPNGTIIDSVLYDGGTVWPDPTGASMVYTGDANGDRNDGTNWITATLRELTYVDTIGDKGSPGTLGSDQAVPVELANFSASTADGSILLTWKTVTETNNQGFEIQRAGIQKQWQKIGFVKGIGTSTAPQTYSFSDFKLNSQSSYFYRLKQIDLDGSFTYSPEIEVTLEVPSNYELAQNFPNPFNPTTNIRFTLPEASNVKLTIFNLLGEEVRSLLNSNFEAGVHNVTFNAANLNSGIYYYRLEANDFVQVRKMMLIK